MNTIHNIEKDTALLPVVMADGVVSESALRVLPLKTQRMLANKLVRRARNAYRDDPKFRRKLAACRNDKVKARVLKDGIPAANAARDWLADSMRTWLDELAPKYIKTFRLDFTIELKGSMYVRAAEQPSAAFFGSCALAEAAESIARVASVPGGKGNLSPHTQVHRAVQCRERERKVAADDRDIFWIVP